MNKYFVYLQKIARTGCTRHNSKNWQSGSRIWQIIFWISKRNGSDAMNIFPKIQFMEPEEQQAARTALLNYCCLDTLAMVRVWEKLRNIEGGETALKGAGATVVLNYLGLFLAIRLVYTIFARRNKKEYTKGDKPTT